MKQKNIVLKGIVVKVSELNVGESFPEKGREQVLEIRLDEEFPQLLELSNKHVMITLR